MKKAFVFPGQGSQKVGMGKEIYENFRVARDVFEEINDSLSQNLSDIIFNGPQETLTLTANAQPAIMCVSIAVMKVLEEEFKVSTKKHISFFAGHSLGEYTALAASKSIECFRYCKKSSHLEEKVCRNPLPIGKQAWRPLWEQT